MRLAEVGEVELQAEAGVEVGHLLQLGEEARRGSASGPASFSACDDRGGTDIGGLLVEVVEGLREVVLGDLSVLLHAGGVRLVEVPEREAVHALAVVAGGLGDVVRGDEPADEDSAATRRAARPG